MSYNRERLGKLLKKARLARNVTLKGLGDEIGVYFSYIADVEAARTTVTPERLDQWCSALGLKGDGYRRVFQARGRLPPAVETYFLKQPWPEDER